MQTCRSDPQPSPNPARDTNAAAKRLRSFTSVHPLATNEHSRWYEPVEDSPLLVQSRHQHRLHRRFAQARARTITALHESDDDRLRKKARKLADCCQAPWIATRSDGSAALLLGCCKDRLCPRCQRQRGYRMAQRTLDLVRRMDARRFITLTKASSDAPLSDQCSDIISQFRELRRRDVWRRHVKGGVWALEVTYNAETDQWHPHIHIIADGRFFPHAELKDAWSKLTGDSTIVDIRKCNDSRDAARYIATYVGKLADLDQVPPERICEYADALHRRRLSGTFGSSHAQSLEHKDDAEPYEIEDRVITVADLERAAIDGDGRAAEAIAAFCQISRTWCEAFNERWTPPMKEQDPSDVPGVHEALLYCQSLATRAERNDDGEEAKPQAPPPEQTAFNWSEPHQRNGRRKL